MQDEDEYFDEDESVVEGEDIDPIVDDLEQRLSDGKMDDTEEGFMRGYN